VVVVVVVVKEGGGPEMGIMLVDGVQWSTPGRDMMDGKCGPFRGDGR